MDTAARRARYSKITTELAHLDDAAVRALVGRPDGAPGWGGTRTVELAGESVFVKIIPLTDLEHARPYSTRNHYRLPPFYQYGVWSAGFGAWREIIGCLTATNWVLADAMGTFPLTYQIRVVPRIGRSRNPGPPDLEQYVRYWNSSRSIGRFISERAAGSYEALIFLEHLPHSMVDWLATRPEDTTRLVGQLCDTAAFLRGQGIVHFDAHLGNIRTDGESAYLTDFGLVLDTKFALTARDRDFLDRHRLFDVGEILTGLAAQVEHWYRSRPTTDREQIRALIGAGDGDDAELQRRLVREVERLSGLVHPAVVEAVSRHRDIIEFMIDFFTRLRANPRKNTRFDEHRLGELLRAADVPID